MTKKKKPAQWLCHIEDVIFFLILMFANPQGICFFLLLSKRVKTQKQKERDPLNPIREYYRNYCVGGTYCGGGQDKKINKYKKSLSKKKKIKCINKRVFFLLLCFWIVVVQVFSRFCFWIVL